MQTCPSALALTPPAKCTGHSWAGQNGEGKGMRWSDWRPTNIATSWCKLAACCVFMLHPPSTPARPTRSPPRMPTQPVHPPCSEVVGNIMIDAMSAKKYYHFIRWVWGVCYPVPLECTCAWCAAACVRACTLKWRLAARVRARAHVAAFPHPLRLVMSQASPPSTPSTPSP